MATFEGNASFVETKSGSGIFKLMPKETGKWNDSNIKQGLATLITAKASISIWSVWIDMCLANPKEAKERKSFSAAEMAAYLKMADRVELVMTRMKWPQLKVKLTKGSGSGKAATRREF